MPTGAQQRGAFVKQTFGTKDAALVKALSDRFVLRTFRFSSAAARMASTAELTFTGAQNRLGAALDGARQELAGLPLAGMVLVSDGADTTDASLTDALLGLKAAAVPVFTVGVGRDRLARDVQIDRVSTPRTALQGTSLVIDAVGGRVSDRPAPASCSTVRRRWSSMPPLRKPAMPERP